MINEIEEDENRELKLSYIPESYIVKKILEKRRANNAFHSSNLCLAKLHKNDYKRNLSEDVMSHAHNLSVEICNQQMKRTVSLEDIDTYKKKRKSSLMFDFSQRLKKAMTISKTYEYTFNLQENKISKTTYSGHYILTHSRNEITESLEEGKEFLSRKLQHQESKNATSSSLSSEDEEYFERQIISHSKKSTLLNIVSNRFTNGRLCRSYSADSINSRLTGYTVTSGYLSDIDILSDDSETYLKCKSETYTNRKQYSKSRSKSVQNGVNGETLQPFQPLMSSDKLSRIRTRFTPSIPSINRNFTISQKRCRSLGSESNSQEIYITFQKNKTSKSLINYFRRKNIKNNSEDISQLFSNMQSTSNFTKVVRNGKKCIQIESLI